MIKLEVQGQYLYMLLSLTERTMPTTPPLTRCFMALCFGAAFVLVLMQQFWPRPMAQASMNTVQTKTAQFPPAPPATVSEQRPVPLGSPTLIVSLRDRRLDIYRDGTVQTSYEVAVGHADWPTPTGQFQVEQMIEEPTWRHPITKEIVPPGPMNPLGSRWIGFWSSDDWQVGFHGTQDTDLIGQAVSHGCIRMREADIQALYDQIEVGTIVIIRE